MMYMFSFNSLVVFIVAFFTCILRSVNHNYFFAHYTAEHCNIIASSSYCNNVHIICVSIIFAYVLIENALLLLLSSSLI